MKKRLLSLLLAAACLMPLSGCNWGEEPEETYDTLSQYYQQSDSTKQDTRLTTFGLPYLQGETWDPITCADGAQQTLGALLYESLYTLGTDFLPQPCLAESASYDAESYALTVTVRSGVTFSDGSALTAWDVVAALRRAKESVRYGQRLAEMDFVSYLGESTLRIYLTRNDPQFAARLDIPIIKGGTQEDTVPVGSGPYRYAKDESGVYLARRTDWWQDKTMPLERIELTACKDTEAASTAQEQHTVTAPTNDATFVYQPDDPAATLPGGESVVLVTGPGGTESGEDAMLWQGIQTFANTYGYTADAQTAAGNTADEAEAALRAAAESGAKLVVCRGDTMGAALYRMQENYPDVHYLLFDSEPHSDDYSAYNTASLVHCVLFQEEQAGYLAGYAAVTDGYTTLGFIGAREIPGIVRYCTGFLQGAEAAAELQGEYVTLQTWFTDTYENNDAITQRMIDWYNNGTSLIMVSGGNLYEGVSDAVNQTGGKAITTDYDNTELGDRVLGSAIKCYNAAVQRQLYTFFAAGTWNGQTGGQTEKAGFTNGEVALVAGAPWRFDSFTQDDYRTLYEDLRTSVLKMDAYSDLDTLPETPNVTVNRLL